MLSGRDYVAVAIELHRSGVSKQIREVAEAARQSESNTLSQAIATEYVERCMDLQQMLQSTKSIFELLPKGNETPTNVKSEEALAARTTPGSEGYIDAAPESPPDLRTPSSVSSVSMASARSSSPAAEQINRQLDSEKVTMSSYTVASGDGNFDGRQEEQHSGSPVFTAELQSPCSSNLQLSPDPKIATPGSTASEYAWQEPGEGVQEPSNLTSAECSYTTARSELDADKPAVFSPQLQSEALLRPPARAKQTEENCMFDATVLLRAIGTPLPISQEGTGPAATDSQAKHGCASPASASGSSFAISLSDSEEAFQEAEGGCQAFQDPSASPAAATSRPVENVEQVETQRLDKVTQSGEREIWLGTKQPSSQRPLLGTWSPDSDEEEAAVLSVPQRRGQEHRRWVLEDSCSEAEEEPEAGSRLQTTAPEESPSGFLPNVPSKSAAQVPQSSLAFKRRRAQLAAEAFQEFNEKVFGNRLAADMDISWSRSLQSTAGLTRSRKVVQQENRRPEFISRILLSEKVCDSEARMRSTLMHELCHAASWCIDRDEGPPHGPSFKRWGARAMLCYPDMEVSRCHNYEVHYPFRWQCSNARCGRIVKRHSNSVNLETAVCKPCGGKLVFLGRFNRDGTPAAKRLPSQYSLFVKENFSSVKEKQPAGTPTAAVMKALAQQWKEQKQANAAPEALAATNLLDQMNAISLD